MVIPLNQCIARPPINGRDFPLTTHLTNVANAMGSPKGTPFERTCFLAGLLHDIGKAQAKWQNYICSPKTSRGAVNHAFLGSVLFVIFVGYYLDQGGDPVELRKLTRLTCDLAHHHGKLGDAELTSPPWSGAWDAAALHSIDLKGIAKLVKQSLPDMCPPWAVVPEKLEQEEKRARRRWMSWLVADIPDLTYAKAAELCLRVDTARLIAGDRFDAADIRREILSDTEASRALHRLKEYCMQRGAQLGAGALKMTQQRQKAQDEATELFLLEPDQHIYTLQLPTGLGKTLTSLRIALTACSQGKTRRIVYVGPYLSILSQAAAEIEAATGLKVMQHHHLSPAEDQGLDDRGYLALESWQSPVVATSFNQFFKALYPRRAQHALRLEALDRAFIIVDEPQIVDERVWNLFLSSIEALTKMKESQILLMTATLPTVRAMVNKPHSLTPSVSIGDRFRIQIEMGSRDSSNEFKVKELAEEVLSVSQDAGSVAVILNTIQDCGEVFAEIDCLLGNDGGVSCINLHGAMHPVHKQRQIGLMKDRLKNGLPTIAVTTQIIEAGVDLSFKHIWRARPVLPCIAQTAGRANRHGVDKDKATVTVFNYFRNEKNTREYVYRDKIAREVTDKLLDQKTVWSEQQVTPLVERFFKEYFDRFPGTSTMQLLKKAVLGKWTELAGIGPFKDEVPKIDVLVPLGLDWSPPLIKDLMAYFSISSLEQLHECYLEPGYLSRLSFVDRKRFMGLLMEFTVPVSYRIAKTISLDLSEPRPIYLLEYTDSYSEATGFGHLVGKADESMFI